MFAPSSIHSWKSYQRMLPLIINSVDQHPFYILRGPKLDSKFDWG